MVEPPDDLELPRTTRRTVAKKPAALLIKRPGAFFWRVVKGFKRNQGILLAGAVAYYGLLSIVPLLALLLVGLSHFMDEQALLATLQANLAFVVPIKTDALTEQVAHFLEYRRLVGWIGIAVLLFFSTLAFTVLENAMSVIFFHRVSIHRRHFLVSAAIPFAFIFLIGIGVLVVTIVGGALHHLDDTQIRLLGHTWVLDGSSSIGLYMLGVLGLVVLLTLLYLVMPLGRIALHHALIGGLTATLLWEIIRHILVWYFTRLSLVNLVYGSFATAIVFLLSFEFAALILLFGAQVIAEFERGESADGATFTTD